MNFPTILIPAYKPNEKMLELIRKLMGLGFSRILVVDDGSGPEYDIYFSEAEKMGCRVLHHAVNMGKGRALKTGLNEALLSGLADHGVITADADGQHLPEDIYRIAEAMQENPDALVLGVRRFTGHVPLRNRLGNAITRGVFALINGTAVMDTQTGLRGLPKKHIPLFLTLKGERYEYEMNMLLEVKPNNIPIVQVPIDTVYIEGNKYSHYRPFIDSVRIYGLILRYLTSSLTAGIVDYGVFAIMHLNFPHLLIESVIVARICSSIVNFTINRNLVFRQKMAVVHAAIRYYTLVVVIMLASSGSIWLLSTVLGMNAFIAKIITDILLGFVSFTVQREFVYNSSGKGKIFKNKRSAKSEIGTD